MEFNLILCSSSCNPNLFQNLQYNLYEALFHLNPLFGNISILDKIQARIVHLP